MQHLSRRQWFEVVDVQRGSVAYKRLEDMNAVEVLMVANWFAKTFPETSAALFAWQAKMRHNPRRAPPDAA